MCPILFLVLYFHYLAYPTRQSLEADLQFADEEMETQKVKKFAQDPAGSKRQS